MPVNKLKIKPMTHAEIKLALEICLTSHSVKVELNHTDENQVVNIDNPRLHIQRCTAAVVNKLFAHGFSLTMTKDGLQVDKY